MNQNDLFHLLVTGMMAFSLLSVIWVLYRRLAAVEKREADLLLEWHAWAASKVQDYGTARLTAAMKKKDPVQYTGIVSAGAARKPSPNDLTLQQTG